MNIAPPANNDLYDDEPAPPAPPPPPPLPNLVHPDDLERVLLRMPEELIPSTGFTEVPLNRVRTTPGLYFVQTGSQELGFITEYLVYVPDQTAYPGRPEAPRNVREGLNAVLAAMALAPRNAYNAFLAHRRERLAAIEADPALAVEARPEPLNVLILARRHITMFNPPETAEQMLERFLERVPDARGTPLALQMLEIYRAREEASRQRYTAERTWRIIGRPRTAASLENFPDLAGARFFRNDIVLRRRKHAVTTWAAARGLLNTRRSATRRNRRHRSATRRSR